MRLEEVDSVNPENDRVNGPRWPTRPRIAPRPSSYRYLLDLDPDLGDELDVRLRLAARPAATARTFLVDAGDLDLSAWLAAASSGPGVLILDGVIVVLRARRRQDRR